MGSKVAVDITEELIEKAESLAARGLTVEQIASCLGMGERTLYEKKSLYPQLAQAIKDGQHKGVSIVANALFESAKSGNTTAQIFYMKARAKWKDSNEDELNQLRELFAIILPMIGKGALINGNEKELDKKSDSSSRSPEERASR